MKEFLQKTFFIVGMVVMAVMGGVSAVAAQEPVCANVRIEIQQELAFERQAFDARMRIVNSLPSTSLTDVKITVWVRNEQNDLVEITSDPNNATAKFFIRVDSLRNISNVSGAGVVQPATDAEIHWLLIPTAGAAEGAAQGKMYFVGATLSYKVSNELQEVEVTPDLITVRPQPELALDYFLTKEVRADDPATQQIEPSEPFTLGVRIHNTGLGGAKNVTIDSAQPKIVENELGLLIGFRIIGSSVQDQPTVPSLLLNFGNIESGRHKVGRWLMETNLAGQFIGFNARFMHADELGGSLTSLLTGVRTHFLIRDVLVDLPGRDGIRDFLALDDSNINVYESEGIDSSVTNYSDVATFVYLNEENDQQVYRLTMPQFNGAAYVSVADPFNGNKEVVKVARHDGKILSLDNAWFAAAGTGTNLQHYFRLFDVNGGGDYFVTVQNKSLGAQPPVLQFIPDRTGNEGSELSFIVTASDPNGTIPTLTLDAKPSGALFTDNGDGTALFKWTPSVGQKGAYTLTFRASDGQLSTVRTPQVRIFMAGDSDGDGMLDSWEMFFFGNLSRDGTGDFDGDGVTDLQEFERDSDPTFAGDIPTVPVIDSPLEGTEVLTRTPTLAIHNSNHGKKPATYDFELFSDDALTSLVGSKLDVPEAEGTTTAWDITQTLSDNTWYYWRARAKTSYAISEWVNGSFFVNTENDPPEPFNIDSPEEGAVVSTLSPILSVANTTDADGDEITYGFEVRIGSPTGNIVASISHMAGHSSGVTSWQVPTALAEDTVYFWRGIATDARGLATSTVWSNFIPSVTNDAPSSPVPVAPENGEIIKTSSVILKALPSIDPENDSLTYFFEVDTTGSFNSQNLLQSGPVFETSQEVRFTVSNLQEDVTYYWRIKASDGLSDSEWTTSSFRVNVQNQAPSRPGVENPGMGAWVSVLTPALKVTAATDPDGEEVRYQFELYRDAALLNRIGTQTTTATSWIVQPALTDHTRYYWRARAIDPHGLASQWTETFNFFTNNNAINDAPTLSFIEPSNISVMPGAVVTIRWSDADPDSNAMISLFANERLIASGIKEDDDGSSDVFFWNTSGVPSGVYLLKAVIADEVHSITVQGGTVTILNVEPVIPDRDGDGIPDAKDNCPYFSNTNQKDSGGLVMKKKDSIGNACQCGDVNGDGIVNNKDSDLIKKALKKGSKTKMKRPDLCHVGSTKGCTVKDAALIEQAVRK